MTAPEEVFILSPSASGIDIHLLPDGSIALYCGTYLSAEAALQVKNGLLALLSGRFNRATTEAYLELDLSRRTARPDGLLTASRITPTTDML